MFNTHIRYLLMIFISIQPAACAGTDAHFRPGYQVLNLTHEKPGKFILQFGEKGLMRIGSDEYGFLLQSRNSGNSVRIVMEDDGKALNIGEQTAQTVALKGSKEIVRFRLASIIRGSAVIHVSLARKSTTAPDAAEKRVDTINIHLNVLQDTTITLVLDAGPSQSISLSAGTEITWTAKALGDILISEASKVELKINGMVFQPPQDSQSMHKVVKRSNGRLIIESR